MDKLPQDPTQPTIAEVIGTRGAWMQVKRKDRIAHFWMKKNRSVTGAITLCGIYVANLENLASFSSQKKCMVCDLWLHAREEVKGKIISDRIS